ncbi:MAG TPA: cupin domain-containing protein [Solirubrobacteraceae bacterium]|nr:cupin domain-containing protein [Solirubrobacteraceae bacterium]
MSRYSVKCIDEMEAIFHGSFKRAGAELGVEAFGMQVFDMPPGFSDYPEHDHAEDGQEEVYLVLGGTAELEVDGQRLQLNPGFIARVGPGITRKLYAGAEGARVLAIGAVPGGIYSRPADFELGAPDPTLAHPPAPSGAGQEVMQ